MCVEAPQAPGTPAGGACATEGERGAWGVLCTGGDLDSTGLVTCAITAPSRSQLTVAGVC